MCVIVCVVTKQKKMVCNSAYGPAQFWVHLPCEEHLHLLIFLKEDDKI